jgi:hypothetical protein
VNEGTDMDIEEKGYKKPQFMFNKLNLKLIGKDFDRRSTFEKSGLCTTQPNSRKATVTS